MLCSNMSPRDVQIVCCSPCFHWTTVAITGPPIGELGGLLVGRPLRKVLRAIEPGKEAEPNAVNTSGFSEAIAISKKAEAKALRKFQGEQTTSITTMVVQGGAAISTVVAGSLRAVPEAEVGTCGPCK